MPIDSWTQVKRDLNMRGHVYARFHDWTVEHHDERDLYSLAELLGYESYDVMAIKFCEVDREICKKLLGVYGYTVFRAILIKQGRL